MMGCMSGGKWIAGQAMGGWGRSILVTGYPLRISGDGRSMSDGREIRKMREREREKRASG